MSVFESKEIVYSVGDISNEAYLVLEGSVEYSLVITFF